MARPAVLTILATCLLAAVLGPAPPVAAHEGHAGSQDAMQAAAAEFLATLPTELRDQATFDFDGPQRTNWNYVPMERVGLPMRDMTLPQRRAARKLMRAALSDRGYLKATTIMSLEQVLRIIESDRPDVQNIRDPEKYWFAVFEAPGKSQPWGWRVEGHHLSLNFTSAAGLVVSATPLFLGANPHEVRVGPRVGLRVLGEEEDAFRKLMDLLTQEQRGLASIAAKAPREVLTVPGEPIDIGKPAGLPVEEMTSEQQTQVRAIIAGLAGCLQPEVAADELRDIAQAGFDAITFAWAGGLGPEEHHYFRLHGPTFIVEYDNAQGNHSHLVWHSLQDDFGLDTLEKHYREHHQP